MKRLKALALVTFMMLPLATATGCKGNKAADKLNGLADKMCACKDKDCGESVMKEMTEWGEKNKETRATKSAMEKAEKAGTKLMECYLKLGTPVVPK